MPAGISLDKGVDNVTMFVTGSISTTAVFDNIADVVMRSSKELTMSPSLTPVALLTVIFVEFFN